MQWEMPTICSETADRLENIEQTIVDTYMENVAENITEDDIKQKMSDETWLSAKDAAELFPRIQEDENIECGSVYFVYNLQQYS